MPTEKNALFLSLRPRFVELLLKGEKTVELRRVRPSVTEGTLVLLYASSPTMQLVGQAHVGEICSASLGKIWRDYGHATGIARHEYDEYFTGAAQAVAITLLDIQRLSIPRPLTDLRHRLAGFQPPQSYRYLDRRQVAALI
jgi:predicted transcriptional regulator